jgi:hypothetical protein
LDLKVVEFEESKLVIQHKRNFVENIDVFESVSKLGGEGFHLLEAVFILFASQNFVDFGQMDRQGGVDGVYKVNEQLFVVILHNFYHWLLNSGLFILALPLIIRALLFHHQILHFGHLGNLLSLSFARLVVLLQHKLRIIQKVRSHSLLQQLVILLCLKLFVGNCFRPLEFWLLFGNAGLKKGSFHDLRSSVIFVLD